MCLPSILRLRKEVSRRIKDIYISLKMDESDWSNVQAPNEFLYISEYSQFKENH